MRRENRSGLCRNLHITDVREAEHRAARRLFARQGRKRIRPRTLGADKGYCVRDFIAHLREKRIAPPRPHREPPNARTQARTSRHAGYAMSQRQCKRIEEIFSGENDRRLRKSRFVGTARMQLAAHLSASAYHLLRLSKLGLAPG